MGSLRRLPPRRNRIHSGVCLVDKYRGAAPARLLFDGISSQDATQTVNALGSAMTCQLRVLDSDDSVSPHAASGWCIHCGVEVTELSTNKQHTLSFTRARSQQISSPASIIITRTPDLAALLRFLRPRRFFPALTATAFRFLTPTSPAKLSRDHMHSEGRMICRTSRHLIRRATSFLRPLHTSSG